MTTLAAVADYMLRLISSLLRVHYQNELQLGFAPQGYSSFQYISPLDGQVYNVAHTKPTIFITSTDPTMRHEMQME